MLPLSGFLLADSKSNSSTLLPRSTTTRVSSGWEGSLIILLVMNTSREARADAPARPGRESEGHARGACHGVERKDAPTGRSMSVDVGAGHENCRGVGRRGRARA